MKKDIAAREMDYRLSESIFLHMVLAGYLTKEEYEISSFEYRQSIWDFAIIP